MKKGSCSIRSLLNQFNFEVLNLDEKDINKKITHAELNRPGLELAGYFDYTDFNRAIVLGLKEIKYIETMSIAKQKEAFKFLTKKTIPYIVISRNLECPELLLETCKKNHFPLFRSEDNTSELISKITIFTNEQLAYQELYHGTLLEIFGVGVLVMGKSGIGKSETALELIKKGHRLIADDSIIIYEVHHTLFGKAPEHLANLLEVRGIGVVDVSKIFGITSVAQVSQIDYVIELVSQAEIDKEKRLSTSEQYLKIMDKSLRKVKIPVAPGRMVADLVEVAVTNMRLKSEGFDATKDLVDNYDRLTAEKGEK